MTKTVHILTEGFHSSNGRAFLMPLLKYRRVLARDYGITLSFFTNREAHLNQCDVLMVDSKFYKPYWASEQRDEAISHFSEDYSQAGKSIFVDLNDSTGWVVPHVLPYVDTYLKSQLAKDRDVYAQPLYEHRPHSDYYHRHDGICNHEDIWSKPITNASERAKMKVGWNSSLANYSLPGPWLMALYERIPCPLLLGMPSHFCNPAHPRETAVSYRFGATYPQETLKYQRLKLKQVMETRFQLPTKKLNRIEYFLEMCSSRIVLSPFGYGEITLKDFETFLCGAVLVKPDMDFLETWPDFYQKDITYAPISWNIDNVIDTLEDLLAKDKKRLMIAHEGQELYRKYLTGPKARALFCDHLTTLI